MPPSQSTSQHVVPVPQTPPRRGAMPLMLGLLAGLIPLGLTTTYLVVQPIQRFILSFPTEVVAAWWLFLLGLYGGGLVGAILMRASSKNQSRRSFAKGMMIGLGGTVALMVLAIIGLVLFLVIGFGLLGWHLE